MKQARQEQDVRSIDSGQMALRLGDGLYQVPVDGMTVDRIVLRPSADRFPGRDPPADTSGEVEASHTGTTLGPLDSSSSSASRAGSAPRYGQRSAELAEVVGCDGEQDQSALRGERTGTQANAGDRRDWLNAPGPTSPGVDDQAVVGPDVVGFPLTLDEAQHPMLGSAWRAARTVRSTAWPMRRAARLTSRSQIIQLRL